jgi:hypothetical protein
VIAQQTLSAQATQTQAALMAEASPTLPPTETPPPQQVLYSSGIAADEPTAPASIEIAGRRFVVLEGQVDSKTGVWEPEGVEWLLDTAVRKVFAIPLEMLKDAQLTVGDPIYVRYRNGYTVTYALTQATDVIVDQIEILNSNKPSMVVIAYTNNFDDPHRLVLIGEIPVPFQSRENAPAPTAIPGMRAVVIGDGVRLRQLPSLTANTLNNLPIGMEVLVMPNVQPLVSDSMQWVFVQSPLGSGWIAQDLLTILR